MNYYYKDSDSDRYEYIREEKLKIHNFQAKLRYFGYFFTSILLYFVLLPFFHTCNLNFRFPEIHSLKFCNLIISYILFGYTFLSSYVIIMIFIKRFDKNDINMKINLFRSLVIRFIFIVLVLLTLPFLVSIIYAYYFSQGSFNDIILPDKKIIFTRILSLYIYNIALLLFLIIFIYLLERLKTRIKENNNKRFQYIYWLYFLKSIIINDPKFIIGVVVFFFFSLIPYFFKVNIVDKNEISRLISYFSFWVTSLIMVIQPLVSGLIEFENIFHKYASHIIKDIIIPAISEHTIIIGSGNLGSSIIKSCFFDIHPEGYGVKSICFPQNKLNDRRQNTLSDFHILIDRNLDIFLVSRRIIFIDKDVSHYKYIFKDNTEFPYGVLTPATSSHKSNLIVIIGICGEARNTFVLNAARSDYAALLVNTHPDPVLSVELAKLAKIGKPAKQVLSIVSFPIFDVLNIFTYDNPVYLVDTKYIEGISISQRVLLFATKFIKDPRKKVNLKNLDDIKLKFPKILAIGNGYIIYHLISSYISSMFDFFFNEKTCLNNLKNIVREVIEEKLMLLTTDENLINEIEIEKKHSNSRKRNKYHEEYLEVFPVLTKNSNIIDDKYRIKAFYLKCYEPDYYSHILAKHRPDLIVLVNENKYVTTESFNRISNVASIINKNKNNNSKLEYTPQIIAYAHKSDKYFISDQIKKHFAYNLKRNEIVGFPSQLAKESKMAREFVASNQFVAMVRSLLHPEKEGDISFILSEDTGLLAKLLIKINKMKISKINNGVRVPSFLFSYSFEDRRYKDTFIFTGTAKLEKFVESIKSYENLCFLNCAENDRREIASMLEDNIGCKNKTDITKDINNILENIPGKFRDCPISSIARHSEKHYDSIYKEESRRLFLYSLDKIETTNKNKNVNDNKYCMPDYAHFKVWGIGLYPGTLAEALTNVLLGTVDKERYFGRNVTVPNLNFCTNYPYPLYETKSKDNGDKNNNIEAKEKNNNEKINRLSQENIYLKIWDEKKFCRKNSTKDKSDEFGRSVEDRNERFNKGIIRAIKIKKGGNFKVEISGMDNEIITDDNSGWLNYALILSNHLGSQYLESYPLYLIEKNYVEGIHLKDCNPEICENEKTELIEINNYKKINFKKELTLEFQIIKKVKDSKEKDRYNIIQEFKTNCYKLDAILKKEKIHSQTYELVLIRSGIIKLAIKEIENKSEFERHQNLLFYIDDL
jgi:hypothetical protein